ncbi:olfactory receptor 142-like [Parambassis ranga]|uniref:Olfactory receptor 142-like n=1 Tax=Parambassis ranga TaxID=210632 RepID=A0A6P7KM56_9TELE|nr:olfactory receptor 142-like [Parambassis ranga]
MMDNVSVITMLTLSGLGGIGNYRVTLFALTLLCYCVIWLVNMTIIVTVIVDKNLHEPMYIFLCNLCINALYGTAGFYPKFLSDLLSHTHVISYAGCLLQGFVLHSSLTADLSLLALMAYDRYVAICRPLVYHSVMTKQKVCVFVFLAWFFPLFMLFCSTITTSMSRLCGSHIPKIYCVNWLVSRIACAASIASIAVPAFNYTFYIGHLLFIGWSYANLIRTCLTSREGRTKFMHTCLPHFICLVTFAVCVLFDLLYMRFSSSDLSESVQNFMAIEFIVIPPIMNPLMYGLKLTKVRNSITQFMLLNVFKCTQT